MRKFLFKLTQKSVLISRIIAILLRLRNSFVPLNKRLKQRFKRTLGYQLNLKSPKTFNEKIQWLKIHDRTPLHVVCSDKYLVREHIKKKIGEAYLVPLIYHTTDVNDLNSENLPDFPVIIKTNHDSGGGTIIQNRHNVDWVTIKKGFKKRLAFNYDNFGKGEWQYGRIKPCIIIEKLLIDEKGIIPSDYKMHFFNGELAFTHVDMDRETDHRRNLYDPEWNFMPCTLLYKNGRQIEKPSVYKEMIKIGKILAEDFIYVRVDLYVVQNKIYFGELTFHHGSGNELFTPMEWDTILGEKLILPIE